MKNNNINIESLKISNTAKIIDALKLMDSIKSKLLIVTRNNSFYSMLSIGDIQRSIIKGFSLDDTIENILRPKEKITIARPTDSLETIRQNILKHKAEFMPVVNNNGKILKLYFWDEMVDFSEEGYDEKLNLPTVIMAGGKGTRLKPITNIIPKALMPVGEKPIIEIIIDNFNSIGVQQFYVSVNYKKEMIRHYFDQLDKKNYQIELVEENKPLGTGGSLSLMKDKLDQTFFVSNCDILIDQDFREVYRYHKENNNEMTIVSALKHYPIPYGTLETGKDGVLKNMKEKPELTFQVNTGMYVLEPHLLKNVPDNSYFQITTLIKKVIEQGGKVGVFPVSEHSWIDIGVWKKYEESINEFKNWMNL
ncbi:MAG: nucleotidyltransferase family protein [Candidatus Aenigmatarchaeota archaeon]